MNNVELLAPAGDFERLKIAFLYGADAVYVGGRDYSLRANATNFSIDELKEAALYAHSLNKKIYVTVNIVFHNEDLDGLKEYLEKLAAIKIDAVIVSDPCVIELINENKIPLEIHLSTQESTLNDYHANLMKRFNVKRIVLAREADINTIKQIKATTNLDLEAFIHGAMCVSFSGRCVLSNITTLRDSNRGGCAQICRWDFNNKNNPDVLFTMTPKDLNMIPYIKEMIDVGINSFKVEGRMRSNYYIATVISTYRKMIDLILDNELTPALASYYLAILNRCANRESTPQFFKSLPGVNEQYFNGREEISNQDFLGLVLGYNEAEKCIILEERNYFKKGDVVEIFGPNQEAFTFTINEIFDEDNNLIDVCRHPKMIVKIPCDFAVPVSSMMRLKTIDKNDYL